ncbi:MAG: hypothetical protein HeimC2_36830 [Candidatus Heimdallarchaeota archaeon LC_2]|nr:MAG: hypothetical protein HeimC2_36830 [Candidatus Heimdallarchaeota archaeon LC_2]
MIFLPLSFDFGFHSTNKISSFSVDLEEDTNPLNYINEKMTDENKRDHISFIEDNVQEYNSSVDISSNGYYNPPPTFIPNAIGFFSSGDLLIAQGSTGNDVIWNVNGLGTNNQKRYRIIRNGIFEISSCDAGNCWGGSISIDQDVPGEIDSLTEGLWMYTLEVWSDVELPTNDTVVVRVMADNFGPQLSLVPGNQTIEKGTTGNIIKWNATDIFPRIYSLLLESIEIASGNWDNATEIFSPSLDFLSIGTYNLTLILYDSLNHITIHTIFIEMVDTMIPELFLIPENLLINEKSLGYNITWNARDRNPTTFIVTVNNNLLISTTAWDNLTIITIPLDDFEEGLYEITIWFSDVGENIRSDTVDLIVQGEKPELNKLTDRDVNEGTTENLISWHAKDKNPNNYTIVSNITGILVIHSSGLWDNDTVINVDLDGLVLGTYIFNITVFDISGNLISDQVLIRVIDNNVPFLTSIPPDLEIDKDASDVIIEWVAFDEHPDVYIISLNGALADENSWNNSQSIIYSIEGLDLGIYNFTIVILDESGNFLSDTVFIEVTLANNLSSGTVFTRNLLILTTVIFLIIFSTAIFIIWNLLKNRVPYEISILEKELEGLISIDSIVIQLPGGVPIYQEIVQKSQINLTLLGGLTAAISAFLTEVSDSNSTDQKEEIKTDNSVSGFQTIEKYGVSITSHHSDQSNIVVVSKQSLPTNILGQIQKSHYEIDKKYGEDYSNISFLRDKLPIHKIFQKYDFKISLIKKLRINSDNLKEAIKNTLLDPELMRRITILMDYIQINEEHNGDLKLAELMEFYKNQGFSSAERAESIMEAYEKELIS